MSFKYVCWSRDRHYRRFAPLNCGFTLQILTGEYVRVFALARPYDMNKVRCWKGRMQRELKRSKFRVPYDGKAFTRKLFFILWRASS